MPILPSDATLLHNSYIPLKHNPISLIVYLSVSIFSNLQSHRHTLYTIDRLRYKHRHHGIDAQLMDNYGKGTSIARRSSRCAAATESMLIAKAVFKGTWCCVPVLYFPRFIYLSLGMSIMRRRSRSIPTTYRRRLQKITAPFWGR